MGKWAVSLDRFYAAEELELNSLNECGKVKRNPEDQSKFLYLVFNKSVVLPGINVNIAV